VEELQRLDAIDQQARRAGLAGKTVEDSATDCEVCLEPISRARRAAVPGVQTCIECQEDLELALRLTAKGAP
jgi:RNA polymerase-binding transcription factor DksA